MCVRTVEPIPNDHHMWVTAARWCLDEWGDVWPQDTVETYLEHYRRTAEEPNALPLVLAAIEDSQLRGVVTLIDDDELPGADEGPWLAACFVDPHHRGKGIGEALVTAAERKAKELGYATLFLYTWSEQDWYEKRGWTPLRDITFANKHTTVMSKDLKD